LIRLLFFFFEGNYLINYLASKGPELEPFVLGSLIQLFCRITKFGWLDDDKFREVVKEAMNFLSQVTWWTLEFDMEVHIFLVCFVLASSKMHKTLKCTALICYFTVLFSISWLLILDSIPQINYKVVVGSMLFLPCLGFLYYSSNMLVALVVF